MSHFFAYLNRMRLIKRWGLMRNLREENVQEHGLQVAVIAHGLALIEKRIFGREVSPEHVMALAAFHEVGEVFTGDLPTPIKYFNPTIKKAYDEIEDFAKEKLIAMLPELLQKDYRELFYDQPEDEFAWKLVKGADKISAYLKCTEELSGGNQEFSKAAAIIKEELQVMEIDSVQYFIKHFAESFALPLDELN